MASSLLFVLMRVAVIIRSSWSAWGFAWGTRSSWGALYVVGIARCSGGTSAGEHHDDDNKDDGHGSEAYDDGGDFNVRFLRHGWILLLKAFDTGVLAVGLEGDG